MIRTIAVEGYRSLRHLVLDLGELTVVTGGNGVGKSSLYRALRLLAACGEGTLSSTLAREGGLPSLLWAGPEAFGRAVREGSSPVQGTRRTRPVAVRLGVQCGPPDDGAGRTARERRYPDDDVPLGYAVDLGLPQPGASPFPQDPEIKVEAVWVGDGPRPSALVADRRGPAVRVRDGDGAWAQRPATVAATDSLLTELVDPVGAPEALLVRETLRSWRFYDHLRTDADAPARQPHVGTRTPALSADGHDLASAIATIRHATGGAELDDVVDRAFPGASVQVEPQADGRFALTMEQPGMLRPLGAAELSDGTLRLLLWAAALLTPRPPALMVVNEPETSLHPDVVPALARLLSSAASRTQVVVVSHSRELVDAVVGDPAAPADTRRVELVKELGETLVDGREGPLDQPLWHWPGR